VSAPLTNASDPLSNSSAPLTNASELFSNETVGLNGESLSLKRGKLAAKILVPIVLGLTLVSLLVNFAPRLISKWKASRVMKTIEKREIENDMEN
jgi:hypothetical protein